MQIAGFHLLQYPIPRSYFFAEILLQTVMVVGIRFSYRFCRYLKEAREQRFGCGQPQKRVMTVSYTHLHSQENNKIEESNMKHIYLNLKRFDVPTELGGVNRIADMKEWGKYIVENTQEELKKYSPEEVEFAMFFPEIHLFSACQAKTENSPVQIGCQGVFRDDVAPGKNFGAFTTGRPAAAMKAAGCETVIIGQMCIRDRCSGISIYGRGNDRGN